MSHCSKVKNERNRSYAKTLMSDSTKTVEWNTITDNAQSPFTCVSLQLSDVHFMIVQVSILYCTSLISITKGTVQNV